MNILIPNMKMPKSCYNCPLREKGIQEDPDWCHASGNVIFPIEDDVVASCPLIELGDGLFGIKDGKLWTAVLKEPETKTIVIGQLNPKVKKVGDKR